MPKLITTTMLPSANNVCAICLDPREFDFMIIPRLDGLVYLGTEFSKKGKVFGLKVAI